MRIVRKFKAWWSGVKFRHHTRQRDKARATALYFLRNGHKDLCAAMLREARESEEKAKQAGALHWYESQPKVRDCFAKIHAVSFTLDDWLDAMEKRKVLVNGNE